MKDEMKTNPSSELISRANAINAIASADPKDREYHYYKHIAIGVISALPSADTKIVRCKGCKYRDLCGYGDIPDHDDGFCSYGERQCNYFGKERR